MRTTLVVLVLLSALDSVSAADLLIQFQQNPEYGYISYVQKQDSAWRQWYEIIHVAQTDTEHDQRIDTLVRVESAVWPVLCDTHSVAILPGADSGNLLIVLDLVPEISWDTAAWFPSDSIAVWMRSRPDPHSILCSHHYSRRYDVAAIQFDESVFFFGGLRDGRPRVLGTCEGVDNGNIASSQDFSQYVVLSQARRIDEWGKTRYYGPVRIYVFDCETGQFQETHEYYGRLGFSPRRQNKASPIYFLINTLSSDSATSGNALYKWFGYGLWHVPDSSITEGVRSLFGNLLPEQTGK